MKKNNPQDINQDKKIKQAKEDFEKNSKKYSKNYDENIFFSIVKKLPEVTTRPFITLYYVMSHPKVSMAEKALCLAALGYVVLPLDIIPDIIPMVGWIDDLGVVALVLKRVSHLAKEPEVKDKVDAFYK